MSTPRVSVVMPVHNGERFLAEAATSILRQSLTGLELVAVNDGSTDGTDRILDELQASDGRVVVVKPGKVGFAAALNLGMAAARAEYVARMDADDIALPSRLTRQLEFLDANAAISACGTAIEAFADGPGRPMCWPATPEQIRANLLFYSPLCHPTAVMRKRDLERHGLKYRDEFGGVADYDLWCQMDRAGLRLANLTEVLLRYRRHANQITSSDAARQIVLADRVRGEQLLHYGVFWLPQELSVHSRLARWEQFHDRATLVEIGTWLAKLERAAGRIATFPHAEFREVLADYWYYACAIASETKLDLFTLFRESPLGRGKPLRTLRLFGKSLRHWLPARARGLAAMVSERL